MTEAEIDALILEAQAAMHRSFIGGAVVESRGPNGTSVRFAEMNSTALMAYISWLRSQKSTVATGLPQQPIYFTPDM